MMETFLPLIYVALNRSVTSDWIIERENDNLKGIQIIEKSLNDLDLSNLNLGAVGKNAFANLTNLKTLNLAKNRLKKLPALTKLSNLESLNLADNEIESGKFYAGLSRLRTLNISNNPLKSFEAGHFFGLTKSTNILTQGLNISIISAAMFENTITAQGHGPLSIKKKKEIRINKNMKMSSQENRSEIKVCVENGHLKSVEHLENASPLPQGCRKIGLSSNTLFLNEMGIKTFECGWYQLQDQNVTSIVLSNNEITQFTKELLNHLPAEINKVFIDRNKINKLEKGIIQNRNNFHVLDLRNNFISEIEDRALERLNLTECLLLDDNRLNNTQFLDSLPPHIQKVSLDRNNITEISAGDFTKFIKFQRLSLVGNHIKEIKAKRLRGFSSLTVLSLRMNRLQNIEPGAIKHLINLSILDLADNKISSLQEDIFSGLEKITHINLDSNEIEEILSDLIVKLPNSLEILALGRNKIKTWIPGRFKSALINRWRFHKIFNLPNLKILDLRENFLNNAWHGSFFKGLKNLADLSLAANKITAINRGLTQHLNNLRAFDLSKNPIKKLKNGAFFGLPKDSIIAVHHVPLELIQGGLFHDM